MRARLVYNPKSGGGHHRVDALISELEKADFDVLYSPREGREHVDFWAKESVDVLVAAGGDGTIARTARALVGQKAALAILPLGTANNIARSLGLTGDVKEMVRGLARPRKRRLDVGRARGPWGERYFIEACGVGLFQHALENDTSSKDKVLSRARALLLAKLESGHAPMAWELEIDGKPRSCELLLLEAMLMQSTGPRLRFAPNANPFDGRFDVVLAHRGDRKKLVRYLKALIAGDEDANPDLETFHARRVRIRLAGSSVRVDDKLVPSWPVLTTGDVSNDGLPGLGDLEVLPGVVEVWLP